MSDTDRPRYGGITVLLIEGEDKDTLYRLKKNVGKERVIVNHQFVFNDSADLKRQIGAFPDGTVFVYTHFRRLRTYNAIADVFGEGEGFLLPFMLHQEAHHIYIGYKKCRGMFLRYKGHLAKTRVVVSRRDLIGY